MSAKLCRAKAGITASLQARESNAHQPRIGHRLAAVVALPVAVWLVASPAISAESSQLATDDTLNSPLVQRLLERTRENQERYTKERLQDYYRRNFKEYFDFEAGSTTAARARGISEETTQKIQQWLKDNQ